LSSPWILTIAAIDSCAFRRPQLAGAYDARRIWRSVNS